MVNQHFQDHPETQGFSLEQVNARSKSNHFNSEYLIQIMRLLKVIIKDFKNYENWDRSLANNRDVYIHQYF